MIIGTMYSSGICIWQGGQTPRRLHAVRACLWKHRSAAVTLQVIREGTLDDVTCKRCQVKAQHYPVIF